MNRKKHMKRTGAECSGPFNSIQKRRFFAADNRYAKSSNKSTNRISPYMLHVFGRSLLQKKSGGKSVVYDALRDDLFGTIML